MTSRAGLLALAAAAAVFFCGIWVHPLHDPDEGRYGEIAREMVASGDLITPRLDAIRYFEKPPLYFWLAAASIRALGATEAAVRLPSALAALACALMVVLAASRTFGPRTAALAALLLATTPMFALFSRTALVDMVLCALVTGALLAAHEALTAPERARRRIFGVAFWALSGLAFVCKGPIGLALPLAGIAVFVALERRPALLWPFAFPLGPLAFAAVAGPWFILMERRNPGYLEAFFLGQNLHRLVSGETFGRDEPVWYYVPVVLGMFAPWTLFLPAAAARAWASARRSLRLGRSGPPEPDERTRAFLAASVLGPFLLLSVAHSKLVYYALPLFPPLAILAADAVAREREGGGPRAPKAGWYYALAAILLLAALAGGAVALAPERVRALILGMEELSPAKAAIRVQRVDLALSLAAPLATAVAFLAAGAATSGVLARKRARRPFAPVPLALALAAVAAIAPWLGARAAEAYSGKALAVVARRGLAPEDAVILFRRFYRTAPFYLERPALLWEARYQEFGQHPWPEELRGRSLELDEGALRVLWEGERRVVAILDDVDDLAVLRRIVGEGRVRIVAPVGPAFVAENRPPAGG